MLSTTCFRLNGLKIEKSQARDKERQYIKPWSLQRVIINLFLTRNNDLTESGCKQDLVVNWATYVTQLLSFEIDDSILIIARLSFYLISYVL